MKRSPWVPLDANFQDDDDIIDLSAHAELLFLRSIAHAKRLENGGLIKAGHLRRLCDKFPDEFPYLAVELADAGLWTTDGENGWTITAYDEWNVSADEVRSQRSHSGRKGNHVRHGHPGELEDCAICSPGDDVSPGGSHNVAVRPQGGRKSGRKSSLDVDVDVDETRRDHPPQPPPTRDDDGRTAMVAVVELADGLIQQLGYPDAIANEGERRYVERALGRGWTSVDLIDLAAEAASVNADDPRRYLLGCIKRRANEYPPNRPPPLMPSDQGMSPPVEWTRKADEALLAEYAARTGMTINDETETT